MAEKPILFNTEMVRAILDGRKTQTRRLVKAPDWNIITIPDWANRESLESGVYFWVVDQRSKSGTAIKIKPPCQPGDILWVRETWCALPVSPGGHIRIPDHYYYRADPESRPESWRGNWRPSIHMPKEAARLFLLVTDVRIERLQYITAGDAVAEGIKSELRSSSEAADALIAFEELWDSTIKPADLPRYGWEANPWVWRVEFEKVDYHAVKEVKGNA